MRQISAVVNSCAATLLLLSVLTACASFTVTASFAIVSMGCEDHHHATVLLLQVDRYHFFPSSIREWHKDALSLLERKQDESASHCTLSVVLRVLRQVWSC